MAALPLPDYRKTLLVGDAVNSDIIRGIHLYFPAAKSKQKNLLSVSRAVLSKINVSGFGSTCVNL